MPSAKMHAQKGNSKGFNPTSVCKWDGWGRLLDDEYKSLVDSLKN